MEQATQQPQPIQRTPTEGFTGDVTWEIEQNSKGVNVRIRGNVIWQNATSPEDPYSLPDDEHMFMVPLGCSDGDIRMSLRSVIQRLTEEARAGIGADIAALEGNQ